VWSAGETVTCAGPFDATYGWAEITYNPPIPIVLAENWTFSGEGTDCWSGDHGSWWCVTLRFSGQFTSDSEARGQVDIHVEVSGWPQHDRFDCDTEPPLTWRAFLQ
jgi:hypothetical protein